ncbi:MAG TPA: hypothetical protein VFV99_29950 [Kofleriaceae bacterium]|nr:hypothetical protein [Kofleriaceae bacterium]
MTTPRTSALSILAVYWLLLILGMAVCITIRSDAQIAAIWTGTVAGTALGHALALLNTRNWFALLTVLTTAAIVGPSAPGELSASTLWLAFIPAACCAFWSLGDRTTLVAFWFPAVIWMLSILDHARANGIPDDSGIVLLGVLAVLFLLFLRVRETRRVALWSAVPAPSITLAEPKPPVMLRERPGFRLARAGWALVASSLAFGATAWVAPRLWQSESLAGESTQVAVEHAGPGLPCCPIVDDVETPRARVKEYFAIGRGHDESSSDPIEPPPQSCRRCDVGGTEVAGGRPSLPVTGDLYPYNGPTTYSPNGYVVEGPRQHGTVGYAGTVTTGDPWESDTTSGYLPQDWTPPTVTGRTYTPPVAEGSYVPPDSDGIPHPSIANTPSRAQAIEPAPVPQVEQPRYEPPPPPQVAQPPVAPAPAPVAPSPEPPAVQPPHAETATAAAPAPASATPRRPASTIIGPSLLHWVGVILAAAVLMQLAALALRPIRRLVTLRHLRKPYWEETVDQRVSNAWQLALVGLRDAGWRPDANESPRDLAQRVGIDGVERCAGILDRARHGIGIDAEDLSTMTSSAEAAYQDARSRLGPVARAATWLRWPLT